MPIWLLYTIWGVLPLFFFSLALWSKLEQVGGKKRQERPEDFLKQGLFVLGCVLASVVVEKYILKGVFDSLSIPGVPYPMYQLLLLPLVMWVGAKIIGPTKDVKISKAPTPSKRRH